jgi:glycosyltransferase involved in cell wall biosynthesis
MARSDTPIPTADAGASDVQALVAAGRHAEAAALIGPLAASRPLPAALALLWVRLLVLAGDAVAAAAAAAGMTHLHDDPAAVELLEILCEHHASRGDLEIAARYFDHAARQIRMALAQDRVDVALGLESRFYGRYIRQRETEAHYHAAFARIVEPMARAGRKLGARLPALPPSRRDGPVRLGFVLHTGHPLGHTDLLMSVLEGWNRSGQDVVAPHVFVLGDTSPSFVERCRAAGVPLVRLRDEIIGRGLKGSVSGQLVLLRARLAAAGVDTMVWVSLPVWSAFAFALRLAPVQIFWAMKFHPVDVPEMDGRVTLGVGLFDRERTIHGRTWRCGPLIVGGLDVPADPSAVAAARAALDLPPDALLLGTVARPEKLLDPRFQDALAALMKARPATRYVWTGRTPTPAVEEAFARHGIADRCRFVGWVDPRVYATALDLFVEPFPFGCGVTGLHAIAAGTPILAMDIPDSAYGLTVGTGLSPDPRGVDPATVEALRAVYAPYLESGLPLAAPDAEAYVAAGLRLLDDADLRRRLGAANAHLATRWLHDTGPAARTFLDHFLAVRRAAVASADP